MTFNTGNPVGSTDARDLYDNAQNFDKLSVGPEHSYPDRLGVPRKSWAGMEADFSAFLAASGFEPDVLEYVDGSPLTVLRPTQLIERTSTPGILYAIKLPSAFPASLSGVWADDEEKLVIRVDDSLRQDLVGAAGAGIVGFATGQSYPAGSIGAALSGALTFVTPERFDAVGDGVADDTDEIEAWLNSGLLLSLSKGKTYKITRSLKVPNRTVLWGVGESTKFVWAGGNGASPTDKTIVFDVSSLDPATNALSNVILEDLHLDLDNASNVIGFNWNYASVKSRGCGLNVYNLGANSEGFRFTKEWYATFRDLSVRNSVVVAGTIGFNLATTSSLGQINRVRMENFQTNRIDVGMLIDTRADYIYGLYVSGEFELGRIGIQHLGGLGVRQGEFNVYLESNTESDVSWGATPGGAGTDVTGSILWAGCAFHVNSKFTIAEGDHYFIASQTIGTLNQSGGRVHLRGSAGVVKNLTGGTLRHEITATALANKTAYGSADGYPLIGETTTATLASATTSAVFSVPTGLLGVIMPAAGRVLRLSIFGRRTYNPVEKHWEGFLSQKADGTWALTKFSYSSADDAAWAVAVNTSTGALTVTFSAADQKVVGATWMPA